MYNEDSLLGADDDSAVLSGLGAVTSQQQNVARRYAGMKIKQHLKERILSREQKFMLANLDQLDDDSRKAIANNQLQFFDFDFYVRILVTGSSDILNSSNVKKVGTSNVDKNLFPKFTNLAIGYVRAAYANNATTTTPETQIYTQASPGAAVLNGELLITLLDKPIIEIPLAKFFNDTAGVPTRPQLYDYDWFKLDAPKLIPNETAFNISWKQAQGVAMPANNNFLEIRIAGTGTRPK